MANELFLKNGLLAIAAASIITYLFRFGGLLLADRLPQSGPLRTFLDTLPGTILLSLVVPSAAQAGWQGLLGVVTCLAIYAKTKNLILTMSGGVLIVALLRQISVVA
ncbi:MAG: AzlD domain-containing protein [Desulforhopalus sp.]